MKLNIKFFFIHITYIKTIKLGLFLIKYRTTSDHAVYVHNRLINLFKLDSVSLVFDLKILSAVKYKLTCFVIKSQVSCLIYTLLICDNIRIIYKCFFCLLLIIIITYTDRITRYADFPRFSNLIYRLSFFVQKIYSFIWKCLSNRYLSVVIPVSFYHMIGTVTCDFRRSVQIYKCRIRQMFHPLL